MYNKQIKRTRTLMKKKWLYQRTYYCSTRIYIWWWQTEENWNLSYDVEKCAPFMPVSDGCRSSYVVMVECKVCSAVYNGEMYNAEMARYCFVCVWMSGNIGSETSIRVHFFFVVKEFLLSYNQPIPYAPFPIMPADTDGTHFTCRSSSTFTCHKTPG